MVRKRTWFILGSLGLMCLFLSACGGAPSAVVAQAGSAAAQPATTAEGRLLPSQSATLSFNANGPIAEIPVKEGDVVKAGDVLAQLDNEVQQAVVAEAEANVAAAQANQAAYQRQLPRQIAAAEAEVKAAQAQQLHAAAGRDHAPAILEATAALAQARYAQTQLETSLNVLRGYKLEDSTDFKKLQLEYANAVKATQAAEAQLAALQAGSPSDRASSSQLAAALADEKAAQARLDHLKAEAAGKAIDLYQAAIQQAEAALLSARQVLSDTEIRAPFAGTVVKINPNPGEQATAGAPAIVLADLSDWQVETKDLTELKAPAVKAGQAVTLKFDALPEVELKGAVESIGQVSHLNSGDVVYPAKIKLLDSDPRLRWGMTSVVQFEP